MEGKGLTGSLGNLNCNPAQARANNRYMHASSGALCHPAPDLNPGPGPSMPRTHVIFVDAEQHPLHARLQQRCSSQLCKNLQAIAHRHSHAHLRAGGHTHIHPSRGGTKYVTCH